MDCPARARGGILSRGGANSIRRGRILSRGGALHYPGAMNYPARGGWATGGRADTFARYFYPRGGYTFMLRYFRGGLHDFCVCSSRV